MNNNKFLLLVQLSASIFKLFKVYLILCLSWCHSTDNRNYDAISITLHRFWHTIQSSILSHLVSFFLGLCPLFPFLPSPLLCSLSFCVFSLFLSLSLSPSQKRLYLLKLKEFLKILVSIF